MKELLKIDKKKEVLNILDQVREDVVNDNYNGLSGVIILLDTSDGVCTNTSLMKLETKVFCLESAKFNQLT